MMKCYACQKENVREVLDYRHAFELDGVQIETVAPAHLCRDCNEATFDWESAGVRDRQVDEQLVTAGIPGRASFKRIRKTLALRAVDAAKLLDVAPETVSRWETGEREIPRYARAILATLWIERERGGALREVLERMAERAA